MLANNPWTTPVTKGSIPLDPDDQSFMWTVVVSLCSKTNRITSRRMSNGRPAPMMTADGSSSPKATLRSAILVPVVNFTAVCFSPATNCIMTSGLRPSKITSNTLPLCKPQEWQYIIVWKERILAQGCTKSYRKLCFELQGSRFPNIDLAKALLVCLNATPTTVPLTTGR